MSGPSFVTVRRGHKKTPLNPINIATPLHPINIATPLHPAAHDCAKKIKVTQRRQQQFKTKGPDQSITAVPTIGHNRVGISSYTF